jgi:hypothetical protein
MIIYECINPISILKIKINTYWYMLLSADLCIPNFYLLRRALKAAQTQNFIIKQD